jgi:hypothetical protein
MSCSKRKNPGTSITGFFAGLAGLYKLISLLLYIRCGPLSIPHLAKMPDHVANLATWEKKKPQGRPTQDETDPELFFPVG